MEPRSHEQAMQLQREYYDRLYALDLLKTHPSTNYRIIKGLYIKARIDFVLRNLPVNSSVLDIGVGNGTTAMGIVEKASHIVGIDISEEAIKIAQQKNSHPNIEYLLCSIESFASSSQFQVVVACDIIEHLYNPESLILKSQQLLEDNGLLIITTPNRDCLIHHEPFKTFLKGYRFLLKKGYKTKKHAIEAHYNEYNYEELETLLRKNHFQIIKSEGVILFGFLGKIAPPLPFLHRVNFTLGSLFPSVAEYMFIAAQKLP